MICTKTGLILLVLLAGAAAAQEWPEFRGPGGQGHATEVALPLEWSESRNVVWKTPVPGHGWSSPVVGQGQVWITSAVTERRDASLRLLAYDLTTGRGTLNVEVFRIRGAELLNAKNSHASPTPVLDGDHVYVHFGDDGTAALTRAGEIVWKTRQRYTTQHGSGASPVLYRDLLIFNCDGVDAAFIVALDKRTGKVRWKTWRRRPWSQAYTTPLVIRDGGRDQIVSVGAHHAAAYDPLSGRELWRVSYRDGFSNVPRPVYGEGLVFITTGFQQPELLAIRPDGTGDVSRTHVAWRVKRGVSLTPSPLLVGNRLYMVTDGGIASCLDAGTGEFVWQHRLEGGSFSASPVFADGRIYIQSEEGVTTVIEPGDTYQPLATNELEGATLASMAVAERSLVIRTATHLYRIAKPTSAGGNSGQRAGRHRSLA